MKKLFFTIYALAVVFAVGCSKEEFVNPASEYKLVVNMDKASFSDDTRAPRNSWLKGDEVMLFFGADYSQWITIKYQNGVWSIKDIEDFDENKYIAELAQRDDKSFTAIYCLHNEGNLLTIVNDGAVFFANTFGQTVSGTLFMTCEDGTYSVEDNLLTINATLSLPDTGYGQYAQFTIRNLSQDVNWFLVEDGNVAFQPCAGVAISCGSDNKLSIEYYFPGIGEGFIQGYNNEDGVTFYGILYPKAIGKSTNYNFGLMNSRGEVFTKTFENKTLNAGDAVIFNGPANGNNNGWQKE